MRSRFLTSAVRAADFPPPDRPELAFFGRSNVGKSTLLNRLANARIARVSRTPGRTQLVNFFDVDTGRTALRLADLPGYGFAAAPKAVVREFEKIVLEYLENRTIRVGLVLIDIRRGLQPDDLEVWSMLRSSVGRRGAELWPVLTKADKLAKARRKPVAQAVAAALRCDPEAVALVSAQEGLGIAKLWDRLERAAAVS